MYYTAAYYQQTGEIRQPDISWETKTTLHNLKLAHKLQLADVPTSRQDHHGWYSVPVKVKLIKLNSSKARYQEAMLKMLAHETIAQARNDFPEAATDGSLKPHIGWAMVGFYLSDGVVRRHQSNGLLIRS